MRLIAFTLLFLSVTPVIASPIENEIFDQHRIDPLELLVQEYQKSRILFMGFDSHSNHRHLDQLTELLQIVGTDPNLKYIVLERSHDVSEFYEKLSIKDLPETLVEFSFATPTAQKRSLCVGEWAYAIDTFFPVLRSLNQLRASRSITVQTIDGISSLQPLDDHYVSSDNRELSTAKQFRSQIWKNLGPKDKAIVLYHHQHLLSSFKTNRIHYTDQDSSETRFTNLAWLEYFFEQEPSAREKSSLILMDEKIFEDTIPPSFAFSASQSSRYPGQNWGIALHHFNSVLTQTGKNIFSKNGQFSLSFDDSSKSLPLPEFAQGMIHFSDAYQFPLADGSAYEATKNFCL